jgi:S-(hydroxymethyl)glutathione dehydrogenase/alcohol dehydrogenase
MRAVVLRQINQPVAVEELTLLPVAAVVKVDASRPLDLAALLGCAVTTGVGAVMRTAGVRPGETVLVRNCDLTSGSG